MGKLSSVTIFTDGACSGNPGPGGWGAIIAFPNDTVREIAGREAQTTNNRMELTAILEAFHAVADFLGDESAEVHLYSDSSYALHGLSGWMYGWAKRGWKSAEGNPIANPDLWQSFYKILRAKKWTVEWHYVRGHQGVPGNERCDEISVAMTRGESVNLYDGPRRSYPVDLSDVPPDTSLPPLSKNPAKDGEKKPTYLSYVNGKLYRDPDWKSCEARVKGVRGAKFKKVFSRREEEEILASWGVSESN